MTSVKQFNIADYFSLYRFIAIPGIIVCIVFEKTILTSILLFISFLTDAIDGYLARKEQIARYGKIISRSHRLPALVYEAKEGEKILGKIAIEVKR